jgi:hypothetical protein
MAGSKGKSGKRTDGKSNNPVGRPKGAKNVVSAALKEKLDALILDHVDTLAGCLDKLHDDPLNLARVIIDLIKLRLPRPVDTDEAEKDRETLRQAFRSRLFNRDE